MLKSKTCFAADLCLPLMNKTVLLVIMTKDRLSTSKNSSAIIYLSIVIVK